MHSNYFNVFEFQQIFKCKSAGSTEHVCGPPVWIQRVQLGETVDKLYKLPECWPLFTPVSWKGRTIIVPETESLSNRNNVKNFTFQEDYFRQTSVCI